MLDDACAGDLSNRKAMEKLMFELWLLSSPLGSVKANASLGAREVLPTLSWLSDLTSVKSSSCEVSEMLADAVAGCHSA